MTSYLNEYDKLEWFDLMRTFKPSITLEEFEVKWKEFQSLKLEHEKHKSLN